MRSLLYCRRCNKELSVGSSAYIQKERRIEIVNAKVTIRDVDIIVCEECSETGGVQ